MTKLEKMTMEELVAGEKAATIVRKNYEDRIVMYRDTPTQLMREEEREGLNNATKNLTTINAIRLNIIKEMEKRLLEIQ